MVWTIRIMAKFAVCVLALLVGCAVAESVSPVQKVIELLDDLKGKVKAPREKCEKTGLFWIPPFKPTCPF